MPFSFIFSLFFTFTFSHCSKDCNAPESFSFVTSNNKAFTLTQTCSQNSGISSSSFSFLSHKSNDDTKRWYYIHILNNYLPEVQKHVKISINDELIKNTFILYLSPSQIETISKYCLFKKIEPSDKINELSLLNDTEYLYVRTSPEYELFSTKEYSIEKKVNIDSYIVKIDQNNLNNRQYLQKKRKIINLLSDIPAVQSISTYSKPRGENFINIGIMQQYNQPIKRGGYLNLNTYSRYANDHNLTGEGQILTLIDTLLDFRHPMFHDDNVEVEFNKAMPDHRKIFYYHFLNGDIESWKQNITAGNHGTHVAGTLSGKTVTNIGNTSINQMFDGSAPGAKILYAGEYGVITGKELEDMMNEHGSRISSNSWGDYDIYVNPLNHEYGSVAMRNPQSLFLFSSGNHGQGDEGYTVSDPGGSKNVLTVAYSENPIYKGTNLYTLHTPENPDFILELYTEYMKNFFETADFFGKKKGESNIIAIDSRINETEEFEEACANIDGPHVTLIYGDSIDDGTNLLQHCSEGYSTNGIVMTENITEIERIIESKEKVAVLYDTIIDTPNPIVRGHLCSIGPGNKGIMKPDVTASGNLVISASSFDGKESVNCTDYIKCGLILKSGSSMATPNVAGQAAIISQYFKSGRWIDSVDLDGPTMRALIINSCKHPSDMQQPDLIFGHGLVDLSRVLPLESEFGVQITHQNEKRPRVKSNGHVAGKIHVNSDTKDLQITLSYLDKMLHESSPIPISRDLDMIVVSPTGSIVHGDHINKDTQHLSTNEKVIIEDMSVYEGDYTIHIFASEFLDSNLNDDEDLFQEFAVVATGDIDNGYIEFAESTQSPCKKNDPDHPDHCLCVQNYQIGPACRTRINPVENQTSYYVKLNSMEIHRIMFTLPNKTIKSVAAYHSGFKEYPSIWISKKCHLSLSEYETNGKVGAGKQIETEVPFESNELCVAIFNNYFRDDAFYHIELFTKSDDDGGDDGGDGGGDEGGDDSSKSKSKEKLFYVGFGILSAVVVALAIVIIVLAIKLKKKNDDNVMKSAESTSRTNTPLLQSF